MLLSRVEIRVTEPSDGAKLKLIKAKLYMSIRNLDSNKNIGLIFEDEVAARRFLLTIYNAADHSNIREVFRENKW